MRLFGFKQKPKKGYLGVDIGASGIKVVQLNPSGKQALLFTYGLLEGGSQGEAVVNLEHIEESAQQVKAVCAKARTTTAIAVTALPTPLVFSSVISIASVDKKDLKGAVEREAKKLLPRPLEEMVLDFKELPAVKKNDAQDARKEEAAKTSEILLTAAPKDMVDKYRELLGKAGLTLASLETEAFALIRALLGKDPTPTVIVDIGGSRSNILMVDRGIPLSVRSVEVGGRRCTEAIAASLKVPLERAEEFKRDLVASPTSSSSGEGLAQACQEVFHPLVNELKYSFEVYRGAGSGARPIERIILTGGGSQLAGLAEFLAAQFNMRVFVGNPWEGVQYHPDLKPLLDALGPRLAVAVGLALRSL